MEVRESTKKAQNTWGAKAKRTLTSLLPVAENRKGQCNRCGECCKLPTVCPFLAYDEEGLAICKIYPVRPPNCRKYPRTESEHVEVEGCGMEFD